MITCGVKAAFKTKMFLFLHVIWNYDILKNIRLLFFNLVQVFIRRDDSFAGDANSTQSYTAGKKIPLLCHLFFYIKNTQE